MAKVNTVLGPIDTADLGFTLTHEHVYVAPPKLFEDYPEMFGEKMMDRAVEASAQAKAGGINHAAARTVI